MRHLRRSSASAKASSYGWDRRRLSASDPPSSTKLTLVYASKKGDDVLEPAALQQVYLIESSLMAWLRAAGACAVATDGIAAGAAGSRPSQ